jgi:surface polysaccharide O-acyltransferase-like enzyme
MVVRKSDITYVVSCVFAAMTAFFYCCTRWFGIKLPRYYPLERTWKWVNEKGVASQAWYAMQGFAFLAAGAVALVVYLVLKHKACEKLNLKPASTRWLGVIVSVVVIVCMGYIVYYEFDKWGIF